MKIQKDTNECCSDHDVWVLYIEAAVQESMPKPDQSEMHHSLKSICDFWWVKACSLGPILQRMSLSLNPIPIITR
eukprot:scaffold3341_cov165-Ochromonas_danica.AAC.8